MWCSPSTVHAHRVDAVRQRRAGRQRDVGGGKAEAGAALGAAAHHARHAPPPAQHLRRALDVALPQLGADGARGEHLAGFRHLRDDGHAEAQRVARALQGLGVAAAALAEAEIVADDDVARRRAASTSTRAMKSSADSAARAASKAQHDGEIEPEALQQLAASGAAASAGSAAGRAGRTRADAARTGRRRRARRAWRPLTRRP